MTKEPPKPLLTPEELRADREEAMALLAKANSFNDRYARVFYRDNTECVETMLRAYLGRDDITIAEARTQAHLDHLIPKSIIMDILAWDDQRRRYNLELQCDSRGSAFKRLVHHGSALAVDSLLAGGQPRDLPGINVLWLTERNATGTANPVDFVARILVESAETDAEGHEILKGRRVDGDVDYYYVDCSRQEAGTAIGDVNHDLFATDYTQMRTPAFRKWTFHYKNTEEGQEKMNAEWEEFVSKRVKRGKEQGLKMGLKQGREEGREQGALERAAAIAKALLAKGLLPPAEIAESTGLSLSEVEALKTA